MRSPGDLTPLYFTGQGRQTLQQTVSHMAAHTSGKVSSRAIASSDKRKVNFRRGRTLSGILAGSRPAPRTGEGAVGPPNAAPVMSARFRASAA